MPRTKLKKAVRNHVEVTPEMATAGAKILYDYLAYFEDLSEGSTIGEKIATEVFQTMTLYKVAGEALKE